MALGVPLTSNFFTKLAIINSKSSSLYLILTQECKHYLLKMWENKKPHDCGVLVTSLGTLWAHRPVNADIVDASTGS